MVHVHIRSVRNAERVPAEGERVYVVRLARHGAGRRSEAHVRSAYLTEIKRDGKRDVGHTLHQLLGIQCDVELTGGATT